MPERQTGRLPLRVREGSMTSEATGLQALEVVDADLAFAPQWLAPDESEALHEHLLREIPWTTHRLRIFGREIDAPRRSCWIGDPGTAYTYSRTRFEPLPWPDVLRPIRARLLAEIAIDFNSVLANLYRDGRDSMGWHSDDEPELGPEPVIASLSLGVTRRFVLRHRRSGARHALDLSGGSLLLMRGTTQRDWKHALPRTARLVAARINLTFRRIEARGG
jgi:alkylated DNA repair dioxygenase AlkB